jgi:hypothetical protein
MTCGYVVSKPVDNRIQLRITIVILWITKKVEITALERLRGARQEE